MPLKSLKGYTKEGNTNSVLIVGKSILLAYGISVICIIIYGILLAITSISESSMSTVITVITMVSIAFSSIGAAVKTDSKGWLMGAIVGLVYMIILFLLSLFFNTGVILDKFILFRILMGSITGALAGIIGINLK